MLTRACPHVCCAAALGTTPGPNLAAYFEDVRVQAFLNSEVGLLTRQWLPLHAERTACQYTLPLHSCKAY